MIEVKSLSFSYGDLAILERLDFRLKRGETVILSGVSGTGKTTLLRLIAGLEMPKSGKITIDNRIMNDNRDIIPPYHRSLGVVFQEAALWPHMSVLEHLQFVIKKREKREILEILQAVGLDNLADRLPAELSAGQAQRLSIARAIAAKPNYLLLDEPFSNLDIETKKRMIKFVKSEAAALNAGLLLITHDKDEASAMGGKQLWMRDGKVWIEK